MDANGAEKEASTAVDSTTIEAVLTENEVEGTTILGTKTDDFACCETMDGRNYETTTRCIHGVVVEAVVSHAKV